MEFFNLDLGNAVAATSQWTKLGSKLNKLDYKKIDAENKGNFDRAERLDKKIKRLETKRDNLK